MTQLAHIEHEQPQRQEQRPARSRRRAPARPHFTERPVSWNALVLTLVAFGILAAFASCISARNRAGDAFIQSELR